MRSTKKTVSLFQSYVFKYEFFSIKNLPVICSLLIINLINFFSYLATYKSAISLAFLNINFNAVSSLEIISAVVFIPDCKTHL